MSAFEREQDVLPGHNLGCRGQNVRLRAAVLLVAIGLGAAILFIEGEFPDWTRALCFIPFLVAAHLAFQGLFRTCPMHAVKGTREDDRGRVGRVFQKRDEKDARRLAIWVNAMAVGLAGVATFVLFLLP